MMTDKTLLCSNLAVKRLCFLYRELCFVGFLPSVALPIYWRSVVCHLNVNSKEYEAETAAEI